MGLHYYAFPNDPNVINSDSECETPLPYAVTHN